MYPQPNALGSRGKSLSSLLDPYRPIAHLPSNSARSASVSSPSHQGENIHSSSLGMQTLIPSFSSNSTSSPNETGSPTAPSSDSSPHYHSHQQSSGGHRSSSSSSDAFSNYTVLSPPSDHALSPLSIVGASESSPEDLIPLTFDSLAKARGASVSAGLASVGGGPEGRTYRRMEPLQAGAPLQAESLKLPSINNPEYLTDKEAQLYSPSPSTSSDITATASYTQDSTASRSTTPSSSPSPTSPTSTYDGRAYSNVRSTIGEPSTIKGILPTVLVRNQPIRTQTLPSLSSLYPSLTRSLSLTPAQSNVRSSFVLEPYLQKPSETEEIEGGLDTLRLAAAATQRDEGAEDEGALAKRHIELIKALLAGINYKWRLSLEERRVEKEKGVVGEEKRALEIVV